jgi:hypothetical protein
MALHLTTTQYSNTRRKDFPFLKLPPELRIYVYRYLIPNQPSKQDHAQVAQLCLPRRYDGQPCCPALLTASKGIYREFVKEWYSHIPYDIILATQISHQFGPGTFQFLYRLVDPYTAIRPHSPLQFVKELNLHIHIDELAWYRHTTAEEIRMLSQNLVRGDRALKALKRVRICITVTFDVLFQCASNRPLCGEMSTLGKANADLVKRNVIEVLKEHTNPMCETWGEGIEFIVQVDDSDSESLLRLFMWE